MAEEQDLENKADSVNTELPDGQWTENDAIKHLKEKNAELAYQALSKKEMTQADKAVISAALSNDPDFLIRDEFVAKIAPLDMNKCPKEGCGEYVANASERLQTISQVLENLEKLQNEGVVGNAKGGKTQVQHLLDNGKLPNGETLGTQTVKNIIYLRAVKKDTSYVDKKGVDELESASCSLLEQMYTPNGKYGANRERRNIMGQKVGELMDMHLSDKNASKRKTLTVEELQAKPYQKTLSTEECENIKRSRERLAVESAKRPLSREELDVAVYTGTATVEQMAEHKKANSKNEADVYENNGDDQKHKSERSNDKFKEQDVVQYMYEEWFLAGLSWTFNKVEDKVLGLIDGACDVMTHSAVVQREKNQKIKDEQLRNSQNNISDFKELFDSIKTNRREQYTQKITNYNNIFADIKDNVGKPNPQFKYEYKPEFKAVIQNEPDKMKDFLAVAPGKIKNNIGFLNAVDDIALTVTMLEMTHEYMKSEKAWEQDKSPKTKEMLQKELEDKALIRQQEILKAIAIISEDTRLIAGIAYEGMQNPNLTREDFIQAKINREVNLYLTTLATDIKNIKENQEENIRDNKLANRGAEGPDAQIGSDIKNFDIQIRKVINSGKMYSDSEFAEEKSSARIETTCSLYEEAGKQNTPSVYEKYKELNEMNQGSIMANRAANNGRKEKLNALKARLESRDGADKLAARISKYQQDTSRN